MSTKTTSKFEAILDAERNAQLADAVETFGSRHADAKAAKAVLYGLFDELSFEEFKAYGDYRQAEIEAGRRDNN